MIEDGGWLTGFSTASLWAYSILVSTVSFLVYVALLRKERVMERA
jgi:hypothetical protein